MTQRSGCSGGDDRREWDLGSVVDDEDLDVVAMLAGEAPDAIGEQISAVPGGDHDSQGGHECSSLYEGLPDRAADRMLRSRVTCPARSDARAFRS